MARVVFEPIGEEIECGEDETVLDAAFREGYSLVYGCREGQCSACKCFLLEGEVSLKPYSTFALSESEESSGYTLLCRAMPDDDLVIELLHWDPDNYKLEIPIRDGVATVLEVEELTHDISRLELEIQEPTDFTHRAGHYVDLIVPGTEDEARSFSMANLPGTGRIELMIKRYPGGRFSGLLESGLDPGAEIRFKGPFGAFYLRESDRTILMIAGGSGIAPEIGLLRELAATASERQIRFFYGARTRRDLCCEELIAELATQLPNFEFIPVLSEATEEDAWDGETGFVHDAADRWLQENDADDVDGYICGPPPMVEAAIEMLVDVHGVDDSRIHFDKFTTNAAAGEAA